MLTNIFRTISIVYGGMPIIDKDSLEI